MMIQINTSILATAQDLILVQNFYLQMKALAKMSIFVADMSLSANIDNKGKDILVLCKGPTKGLDGTALTAETKYPINLTQSGK